MPKRRKFTEEFERKAVRLARHACVNALNLPQCSLRKHRNEVPNDLAPPRILSCKNDVPLPVCLAQHYRRFLAGHKLLCSMSAVGSCADNAACEGFFGMLKRERVNRETIPDTGRGSH